jgi:TRAP-type C4-dicarboxylate transport system permease small subunit
MGQFKKLFPCPSSKGEFEALKVVRILQRLTDYLINVMLFICCAYTVLIAYACVMQVFSRYVINASFPWTEETARLSWISMGALGLPVALKKNTHVKIDILASRLRGTALKVQQVSMYLLIMFASYIFCTQGYRLFTMTMGNKGTAMRWFPMELIYATVPIGGGVTIWVCVVEILAILFLSSKEPNLKEV